MRFGSRDRRSPSPAGRGLRFWATGLLAVCGLGAGLWLASEPLNSAMVPRGPIGPFLDGRLPERLPASGSRFRAVDAFPRLEFDDPVLLLHDGNPGRLYVCGRQGTVERFENRRDVSEKSLWLDLRDRCQGWDDSGLLGMAFHPQFGRQGSPNRGFVYVWYSHTARPEPGPARPRRDQPRTVSNRLSRFTVPDGAETADPSTELVLIDQPDRDLFHNGGGMFFHPGDGFLYLALGDEGMGFDNAQRIDKNLFSGVIRIDVDCKGGTVSHPPPRRPATATTAGYFIPNDNPWVGVPGALEEFWCIGLRSPHRMTYDPVSRTILAGDVGDRSREEIDIIIKGGNYQWSYREGSRALATPRPAAIVGVEQPPVFEYGHDQGAAVIGGHVYRGREHAPWLTGRYVFGDMSGRVWALELPTPARGAARVVPLCDVPLKPGPAYGTGLSSFGVDADGELYLCVIGQPGKIYRLESSATPVRPPPAQLSKTGAFRELRTLEPAPGLVPYEVNSPLWSDGAEKRRWIAVPNSGPPYEDRTRIRFDPKGPWQFPAGTVFVKHFELPTDTIRPGARRRLETRLLVRDADGGAYGITYRWRDDHSDADLIDEAQDTVVPIRTAGGLQKQTWTFPGRRDCLACHTAAAGFVLGVNTRQLNRSATYREAAENQLRGFESAGMLADFDPGLDPRSLPKLAGADAGGDLERRVRSYLDANCGQCHRPNGVRAEFDARFETPLDRQRLIGGWVAGKEGRRGGELVRRGDPDHSLLVHFMQSTDAAVRMPPLGRNVPDRQAIAMIREWIASLATDRQMDHSREVPR